VLAGLAYDLRHSYEIAFLTFISAYLIAAVLILLTPTPRPPREAATTPAGAFSPAGGDHPPVTPPAPPRLEAPALPLPVAGDQARPPRGARPPRDYMRPPPPAGGPPDYMRPRGQR
jgi:hypothetical protein